MKAFPNGLYRCQTTEKQHDWPFRLPGIMNLKGGMPVDMQMNINSSFEALSGEFV